LANQKVTGENQRPNPYLKFHQKIRKSKRSNYTPENDLPRRTPLGNRACGCVVRPLPFREPTSAAPAVALEFHHAAAALWADQIDNRGDDARAGFSWQPVDSHGYLLSRRGVSREELQIRNDARRNQGLRVSVNLTPVPSPSSVPRWLAAEFVWAICTDWRLAPVTCLQTRCQIRNLNESCQHE
jgi:hypothetical protein